MSIMGWYYVKYFFSDSSDVFMKERLVGTDWCDCDPCSTLKRHCVLSTCVNHLRCVLKSLLTVEYLFSHLTLKAPTIPKKKRYLQNLIFTNLHYLNPTLNSKINSPNLKKGRNPTFSPASNGVAFASGWDVAHHWTFDQALHEVQAWSENC